MKAEFKKKTSCQITMYLFLALDRARGHDTNYITTLKTIIKEHCHR